MQFLRLDSVFQYGKHVGEQVEDVLEDDPGYLAWLYGQDPDMFDNDIEAKMVERKLI